MYPGSRSLLEHRLKEPAEGDVFLADVFLDLLRRKIPLGLFYRACKPGFDDVFGLSRIEGEEEVVEAQRAPRSEYGGDPFEGERFEEVGQVVQGVPGVDEVGRLTSVLVLEKPPRTHSMFLMPSLSVLSLRMASIAPETSTATTLEQSGAAARASAPVPVPLGRPRPRVRRLDVGAELGQPPRVGIAQPLEGAVLLRSSLGSLICRRLIFPRSS